MDYLSFLFNLLLIASKVGAELFVSPAGPYFKGETITLTCIIQPSSGTFTSTEAAFQFNNSATCYVGSNINNGMTGDINSTRYTYTGFLQGSSLTNATGVLVIDPFMVIDATFPFACCGAIGGGLYEMFNNTFLLLADPPSAANISISTTYDSAKSCTGTITLTWLAVASDRAVTNYTVYLNDTFDATFTSPMAMYNYATVRQNLSDHHANYTVTAISPAGSNSSSVIFIPPDEPNKPQINTVNYTSDFCTANVTIIWDHVVSDRIVTHYEVLYDNIIVSTVTTNNYTHQIDLSTQAQLQHIISVKVFNCVGFNTSDYSNLTLDTSGCGDGEGFPPVIIGVIVIVIVVIVLLVIICIVVTLLFLKKRKKKLQSQK